MLEIATEDRLTQLKSLLKILAEEIDERPGARDMAQLTKQYRETLKEIEEISGNDNDDAVGQILSAREADGKSNSVR